MKVIGYQMSWCHEKSRSRVPDDGSGAFVVIESKPTKVSSPKESPEDGIMTLEMMVELTGHSREAYGNLPSGWKSS